MTGRAEIQSQLFEEMSGEVVCIVNAIARNNSQLSDIKGKLSVICISDTHFLGSFHETNTNADRKRRDINLTFDLDWLDLLDDKIQLNIHEEQIYFDVPDILELSLLLEAIIECRELCDATLRLKSLVEDIYYAGVYSSMADPGDMDLQEELTILGRKSNSFKIFDLPIREDVVEITESVSKMSSNIEIYCIYCDYLVTDVASPREFVVHPFVPVDCFNKPVYMCDICVNNWKDFRDKATQEDILQLPGMRVHFSPR
jgi:hypothetical protein